MQAEDSIRLTCTSGRASQGEEVRVGRKGDPLRPDPGCDRGGDKRCESSSHLRLQQHHEFVGHRIPLGLEHEAAKSGVR
eukprot:1005627-Prorocentrum_minimum.AAC.1